MPLGPGNSIRDAMAEEVKKRQGLASEQYMNSPAGQDSNLPAGLTRSEYDQSLQPGWRQVTPFVSDLSRQQITAPFIDPSMQGSVSSFDRVGYNTLAEQAAAAGRGVAGQQQSLADALLARSQGRGGPSLAELQLQQTLAQQQRNVAGALAGAGRSMNPALAQRLLLRQQNALSGQTAGQAAMLRAQEQLAAQTALGNQLGAMRGAEQAGFASAGQLGLGQEKLGVETQEAQKGRALDIALANQRSEQFRQNLQQQQENQAYAQAAASRANAGNAINTAIAQFADGGKVMPKAKIVAAHEAAKSAMPEFKKQYGSEAGKKIAYATMMKMAKQKKLADGGEVKELTKLDNEKNDVVPAMLSEGEIVLPRSIVAAPNAPIAAAKFVEALLQNKDKKDAKLMALKVALGKK